MFICGRRTAAVLASLVLVAAALPLTACGASTTSADDSAIKAVASTTQICDYITQLASDGQDDGLSFDRTGADGTTEHFGADTASAKTHLTLTCLLAPNASAHEHDMTAEQSRALSEADLFFVSGVDLEHFLDDAVTSTGFKGSMVVTSGVAGAADVDDLDAQLAKEKDLPYTVDRGTTKVDVATWPFPPEDGESEPEFRFDPHVWTSPANAIVQVTNIGAALENASPESAELLSSRTQSYIDRLNDLDAWAHTSLETVPADKRVLFTSHDAFGYFSAAYGVTFKGAALSDFNAQQDATAQKIDETAKAVTDSGAVAIFAENSNNPESVDKVARTAGVKAIVGDEALYGDSLGDPGSDGETYIGSILHNVTNLTKAWDGTVAEIPESLNEWTPMYTEVK
ncbi:metal ABC transporter substrate-binding protein [Actinomyces massiliensis]|uniref:Periplasmic solute-binding family protein n=1 Tax=Actinomyces massiliensis F0489 TaxID=1125718 RepID=J0NRS1_9ACTO|nr:metal ABC transporter substrate-binding protein [Actinomyces massiliensis]EJF47532.1 periplasmic solute-binding family protein [Actinomyces massiliensis F0489]WLD73070.1 metal ABC transporter substrate-binding protein [Actinomyces massiliensis]